VLLFTRPVIAQDRPMPSAAAPRIDGTQWEPLGAIPVDQAGAGRRGYVLPGESTDITEPGADQVSFHAVAANAFYREQTGAFLISQRYEAHTMALGYRRGFKVGSFPRFEIGGQVQLTESDNGFLNGFIQRFEDMWVSVSGRTSAKNQLRANAATLPPLGTLVTKNGRPLYSAAGNGSGFGDVYVVANALLREAAPSSNDTRVAARVALNLAGKSEFTQGNFAGMGVSVDTKLSGWAAFHTDIRGNLFLNRTSHWGLPLKRGSFAFSAGPELKLARNSSISLQIDGSTTPYRTTGVVAFDEDYGDITLGLSHRFTAGRRRVVTQIYARENMNLPFRVRWNTDPDLSIGIKATIR
jgi:hypothetical protein